MKLYTYFRSSAAFRTRIALNLKGIDYEPIAVDLRPATAGHRTPEFLALNPQGLVPALVDGNTTIAQSLAIIEYLDETHPVLRLHRLCDAVEILTRFLTMTALGDRAGISRKHWGRWSSCPNPSSSL